MNFEQRARELVSKMTLAEKISQLKNDAPAIERLGVPAYNWWNEGLHGVARAGCATVFPQAIGMAASFNTELMRSVAEVISDEARAKYNEFKKFGKTGIYRGLTYWSPNINIFRDPRWGRGHETYGEDPYLTAKMGVEFIEGLQGDGEYRKLDATVKHFAVHSGPERLRHEFNAVVSEKDLYETYLWAFEYCIRKAKPAAVMGAYNRVNGEACCASKTLLQDILRGKFGFEGYVVSDCGAICDIDEHHKITETRAESAALALNNGCELNCGWAYPALKTAVAAGLVSEETITEAAVKLFKTRFELGMFDECEYDKIEYSVLGCKKHREINREMAQESIVLLKNNGILPLNKTQKVAVIGPNAESVTALVGNYNGRPIKPYTLLRGMQEYTDPYYALGCELMKKDGEWTPSWLEEDLLLEEAISAAVNSDVVILCMGLNGEVEGEEIDADDKQDLEFPKTQQKLYEEIIKLNKKVIFVNVSGSCLNLSRPADECDAVIQCFYPGEMGGLALADILYGEVSPSGRLPVTFYKNCDDLPAFEDYSMESRTYRFYKGKPVYEFGYGLTYSDIDEKWIDENTVEVTNNGEYDAKYSVLKYVHNPAKTLSGFKKIFIKKGETKTVTFDGDFI